MRALPAVLALTITGLLAGSAAATPSAATVDRSVHSSLHRTVAQPSRQRHPRSQAPTPAPSSSSAQPTTSTSTPTAGPTADPAPTPSATPTTDPPTAYPTTAPPSAVPTAPTGLTRDGAQLRYDGQPWRATGVNGFELTTFWPVNWGCGSMVGNQGLDGLFASLRPHSMVRTWAFQALGYDNKNRHAIDFTGIDRVVQRAQASGTVLVLTLSDQAGTCDDGHWHDRAWYQGGYKATYDDGRHLDPLSYWDWMHAVVSRYADVPGIIWEPVNEPEASDCQPGYGGGGCYGHGTCAGDAAAAMRRFFDTVGAEIHRLAPRQLVASGALGMGECGMVGDGWVTVHGSPGLDIGAVHDYSSPADTLNGAVKGRLDQGRALGLPVLVEEVGLPATGDGNGCATFNLRAQQGTAKARAAFDAGASAWMPWWWVEGGAGGCNTAVAAGDPLLTALHDLPLF